MGNAGSVSLLQSHLSSGHVTVHECSQTGAVAPVTALTAHPQLPIVALTSARPHNVSLITPRASITLTDEMPHLMDEADTVAHTLLLLSTDRVVRVAPRLLQCFTALNESASFSAESVEFSGDHCAMTAAVSPEYNERFVFIGTSSGEVRVFDSVKCRMSDYAIAVASERDCAVTALAVLPSDYTQILVGCSDGALVSYETINKRRHREYAITDDLIRIAPAVTALAWNSSGESFVSGHDNGLMAVWTRTAVAPVARFFVSGAVDAVAMTLERHRIHQLKWTNDGFYVAGGNVRDTESGHVVFVSNDARTPLWSRRNNVTAAVDTADTVRAFAMITLAPPSAALIVIALSQRGRCSVHYPSITPLPPPMPMTPLSDPAMPITAMHSVSAENTDALNALIKDLTFCTPQTAMHQTFASLQRQRISLWTETREVTDSSATPKLPSSTAPSNAQSSSSSPLPLLVCTAHGRIIQMFNATNPLTLKLICSVDVASLLEWNAATKTVTIAHRPHRLVDADALTIVCINVNVHKRQFVVGCSGGDVFAFDFVHRHNGDANAAATQMTRAKPVTASAETKKAVRPSNDDRDVVTPSHYITAAVAAATTATATATVTVTPATPAATAFLIPPSADPSPSPEPSMISNAATAGSSQPPSPVSDGAASDVSTAESPELAPTDNAATQQPETIDLRVSRSPSPKNTNKTQHTSPAPPNARPQFFFEAKFALSVGASAVKMIEHSSTDDRIVVVDGAGDFALIDSANGKVIKSAAVKTVTATLFSTFAILKGKGNALFLYVCTSVGSIAMLDARSGDQIGFIARLHDGDDAAPIISLSARSVDPNRIAPPLNAETSKPRSRSVEHDTHMPHQYAVVVSSDAIRLAVADKNKPIVIHTKRTSKTLIYARTITTPHTIQPVVNEAAMLKERKPSADAKRLTFVSAKPSREDCVVAFDEDMALYVVTLMDLAVIYSSYLTVPPNSLALCNVTADARIVYAPTDAALIQTHIFPDTAYGLTTAFRIDSYTTPPAPAASEPTSTSHSQRSTSHSAANKKSGFSFSSMFKRGSTSQLTSQTAVASSNVPSPTPSHLDVLSAVEPVKTSGGGGDDLTALLSAHELSSSSSPSRSPVNIVAEIEQVQTALKETRARLEVPSTIGGRLRAASDTTTERSQTGKAVSGVNAVAASNVSLAASNLQRMTELAERSDQLQTASADFAAAARARLKEAEANSKRSFLGLF